MADREQWPVEFTPAALEDLAAIATYRSERRGIDDGETLLDALLERCRSLQRFPRRGPQPKELAGQGEDDVRQIASGVHRIIYEVQEARVLVILVADGRRDMQRLLRERLRDPRASA